MFSKSFKIDFASGGILHYQTTMVIANQLIRLKINQCFYKELFGFENYRFIIDRIYRIAILLWKWYTYLWRLFFFFFLFVIDPTVLIIFIEWWIGVNEFCCCCWCCEPFEDLISDSETLAVETNRLVKSSIRFSVTNKRRRIELILIMKKIEKI